MFFRVSLISASNEVKRHLNPDGRPGVVIDWKSDVNPDPQTLDHYRAQVRAYLDMTGAEQGLIVLMTSATVIIVAPSPPTMAA